MTDIEKAAKGLNENMAHAVIRAWRGGVQCDVPLSTQRALVRRGLAAWDSDREDSADLTDLGLQVQEYLKEKKQADQYAKDVEIAAKFAAERKIRDEGYEAGRRQSQLVHLTELNRAVYGCDTWPDRPWDSVWEHLIGLVTEHFQPDPLPEALERSDSKEAE